MRMVSECVAREGKTHAVAVAVREEATEGAIVGILGGATPRANPRAIPAVAYSKIPKSRQNE